MLALVLSASLSVGMIWLLRCWVGPREGIESLAQHDSDCDNEIAADILRYFLRNPQAADDLEGVARWRLLDERIRLSIKEVSRALNWLVSEGFLVREEPRSSNAVFRLNTDRRADIERFMEERGSGKTPPGEE